MDEQYVGPIEVLQRKKEKSKDDLSPRGFTFAVI